MHLNIFYSAHNNTSLHLDEDCKSSLTCIISLFLHACTTRDLFNVSEHLQIFAFFKWSITFSPDQYYMPCVVHQRLLIIRLWMSIVPVSMRQIRLGRIQVLLPKVFIDPRKERSSAEKCFTRTLLQIHL